jgi:hypothetical protein
MKICCNLKINLINNPFNGRDMNQCILIPIKQPTGAPPKYALRTRSTLDFKLFDEKKTLEQRILVPVKKIKRADSLDLYEFILYELKRFAICDNCDGVAVLNPNLNGTWGVMDHKEVMDQIDLIQNPYKTDDDDNDETAAAVVATEDNEEEDEAAAAAAVVATEDNEEEDEATAAAAVVATEDDEEEDEAAAVAAVVAKKYE